MYRCWTGVMNFNTVVPTLVATLYKDHLRLMWAPNFCYYYREWI